MHEVALGAEVNVPPRPSQPLQVPPSHALCHIPLSLPRTKRSIRFGPHETALGSAVSTPPRPSQPLQREPSQDLCQRALSAPLTKMSSRPALQEATTGLPVRTPPCDSQPDQLPLTRTCIEDAAKGLPGGPASSIPEDVVQLVVGALYEGINPGRAPR